MDNQDPKPPDSMPQSSPTQLPEPTKQPAGSNLNTPPVSHVNKPLSWRLKLLAVAVAVTSLGFVVLSFVILNSIMNSFTNSLTKPANPVLVQAAYTQTANAFAKVFMINTVNPSLFAKQSLSIDASSGKTNEVNMLYCYSVSNNANLIDQISQGFPQTDPWTYAGQADGTEATISALQTDFQQTGSVNLRYETQDDSLATSNPDFYPAAVAFVTVNSPATTNPCSAALAKDRIDTTNKSIVTLQLDLFDWPHNKNVLVWQASSNNPQFQSLSNELNLLGLSSIDKQTSYTVSDQDEIYAPNDDYGDDAFSSEAESIDTCYAGNEDPALALTAITNAFANNGWKTYYQGDDTVQYAVNAFDTHQSVSALNFIYSKNSSLGQINAYLGLDGTDSSGAQQCTQGSYTHAFSINITYQPF
jgi:hypothetical protein